MIRPAAGAARFVLAAALAGGASGPAPAGGAAGEADAAACERLNDAGRFAESLPRCAAALSEARRRPTDGEALARALNSHALALEMTGARGPARDAYEEALALHRAAGAREREALVLSNLAALAIGAGDYGAALDRLAEEEAVARAAGDEAWTEEEIRIVRINRAVALEQLGAYREALAELRRLDESGGAHDAARQVNLAVLYRNLGDPRRALRLLDAAAVAYEREGDRAALANVELNRALAFAIDLDEPAAARAALDRALALARAAGDRAEELRTLAAGGELALAEGDGATARRDLTAALEVARASGARAGEWAALAALGRVEAAAGDDALALARLGEAEALVERASAEVGDSALGSSLRRDLRRLYATAVDLLAERGAGGDRQAAAEALAWSERLKERELLDALSGEGTAPPLDAAALAGFGARSPALAWFVGERNVWRFRLDASGIAVAAAGEAREIVARVLRVRARLERGEAPDPEDLEALAAALLPADLGESSSLLLVPDGALFYLPFALLPDPSAPGKRLVESRALASSPSLSVVERLRAGNGAKRWRFAGFAAPEAGERSGSGTAALLAARYGLPPLPGSAREAERAAALLGEPAVVELGAAATEAKLRARAAEGAAVLHLATHTLIDEGLERGVAVFLSPGSPAAGAADDGRLTPAEIARGDFRSGLVVLSGCRTALEQGGGAPAGNALASLAGSFLAAGASGVLASLWEVGDAATAALMEQLYFELGRGAEPAEALRRAQQRLAADARWGAPHRWAAFVLLGRPAPVLPARARGAPLVPLAGALALLAGAALLWRSRGRRGENRA